MTLHSYFLAGSVGEIPFADSHSLFAFVLSYLLILNQGLKLSILVITNIYIYNYI